MKPIGELSSKQVEHATDQMVQGLKLLENDIPHLPEHIFREALLPILANAAQGVKVDLNVWTDVAGTTYRAIDVIDSDGTVLFRVPSLHRQLPTEVRDRTPKSARNSVLSIITQSELIAKNSPRAGTAHLQRGLSSKVPRDGVDMDRARAFDAILRRYGYPGILPDAVRAPSTSSVVETPRVDIESFDDFESF